MTAKDLLLKQIPEDCLWLEMDKLVNCPIEAVTKAMVEFAEESKKGLFTAKAMQEFAIEVANYDQHSNPRKSIDTHLEDFLQWYKDEDC
jgi:hypothetical protein